jgi:leucyl aminopeptidase
MHIVPFADNLAHAPVDLLVVGLHTGDFAKTDAFKLLDRGLGGLLSTEVRAHSFTAKPLQTLSVVNRSTALKAGRVTLVGLGPRRARSTQNACEGLLRLAGTATRLANGVGAKEVLLSLPLLPQGCSPRAMQGLVVLLARGAHLGGYRYTAYRCTAGRPASVKKMHLHLPEPAAGAPAAERAALEEGRIVAEATALVRDLVNQPPMDLYPQSFAERAAALAKEHGLKCTILDPARLQKAEMNLLLAVGRGSERPPRLVHLSYTPKKLAGKKPGKKASAQPAAPVVLVGKGITFDSGGLSLKAPDAMYGMKMDMAGAAAALAAVTAAARLQLQVPVHAILAMAENMPSGRAIRPGDVFVSAAGISVEVNNTDAEGRLVLADALHYALQLGPRCIVDLATLTGACMVALGRTTTGLFSNSTALADALLASSAAVGEDLWRLPLTLALREQLRSDVADMKNTGERFGGAITAALFLQEFVGTTAWAHLDIAGSATGSEDAAASTKGGTGVAVATLINFLSGMQATPAPEFQLG